MIQQPWLATLEHVQPKLHGLAVGMTLGIGSIFLSQSCPLLGQCPTCAACVPRLPLLALPLVVDGLMILATRAMKRKSAAGLRLASLVARHRKHEEAGCDSGVERFGAAGPGEAGAPASER